MRSLILALLLSAAAASPIEAGIEARATQPFCSTVKAIVTSAKQQAAATTFCASYLHLSTVTKTSTVTSTVTSTTAGPTTTITTALTGCAAPASPTKKAKRELEAEVAERAATNKPKPSCFSKYTASAVLSSACSCLSVPPPTTTATTTTTTTTTVAAAQSTVAFTGPFEIYFPSFGYGILNGQDIYGNGAAANAATFMLAPNGNLIDITGGQAGQLAEGIDLGDGAASSIGFNDGDTLITCTLSNTGGTCPLVCRLPMTSVNYIDVTFSYGQYYIGSGGFDAQLQQVTPYAVSVV